MKKLYGEERRNVLLEELKQAARPMTGGELGKLAQVSRQVVVGDMTLLKAKGEPIIATSQGYLYLDPSGNKQFSRRIACNHKPEETEAELRLLVECGVTVKDVSIEHPVYGELTAGIHVSTQLDVDLFMQRIRETGASYLLELTEGTHIHTITADQAETLTQAIDAMKRHGYLLEEGE
ncbi:MAG: transcription repressor NadR [Bacillota bacterium]